MIYRIAIRTHRPVLESTIQPNSPFCVREFKSLPTRGAGGIGRRAGLRSQWPQGRAGSSPVPRTTFSTSFAKRPRHLHRLGAWVVGFWNSRISQNIEWKLPEPIAQSLKPELGLYGINTRLRRPLTTLFSDNFYKNRHIAVALVGASAALQTIYAQYMTSTAKSEGEEFFQSLRSSLKEPHALHRYCDSCSAPLVYCDFEFWLHGKEDRSSCTVPIGFCPHCDGLPTLHQNAAA